MAYINFKSTNLSKFIFDNMRSAINTILTLKLLSTGEKTILEISNYLEQIGLFEGKTDAYFLTDRLNEWKYIVFVVDTIKYKSKIRRCRLTELGKMESIVSPDYLKELDQLINDVINNLL